MNNDKIIGVVGGVGPYAGLDLVQKIFDQTLAERDQDHLSVAMLSLSEKIGDRTPFILGQSNVNPGHAISKVIIDLERIGAGVAGIPCNTAHAPQIYDIILEELGKADCKVNLIHMIAELAKFIRGSFQGIPDVGLLATRGTYESKVYEQNLERYGIKIILPREDFRESIHNAIYSPVSGIKAKSNPVTETARQALADALHHLQTIGADAVVLGCTELPLAVSDEMAESNIIIDPTLILARALIREVNPVKLKPLNGITTKHKLDSN
jgi:aspartate racemase